MDSVFRRMELGQVNPFSDAKNLMPEEFETSGSDELARLRKQFEANESDANALAYHQALLGLGFDEEAAEFSRAHLPPELRPKFTISP